MSDAQTILKELKRLAESGGGNAETNEKAKKAVLDFKLAISEYQYLPPNAQIVKSQSKNERLTAMQGYEYACILAAARLLDEEKMEDDLIETRNDSLEKHFLLLQPFYFDYRAEIGDSPRRTEIIGLELLALLLGQKLGDFYSLLERIPIAEREDKYIAYVVSLEKYLMEGNYNQLLSSRKKSPSKLYKTLLAELEVTVRNEVASCIEQSYPKITIDAAAKLMNCKNELVQAIAEKRESWVIGNGGNITFKHNEEKKMEIPVDISRDLVKETLNYANELERIV